MLPGFASLLRGVRRPAPIPDRIRPSGENRIDSGTIWCHDRGYLGQAFAPFKRNRRTKRPRHHQDRPVEQCCSLLHGTAMADDLILETHALTKEFEGFVAVKN